MKLIKHLYIYILIVLSFVSCYQDSGDFLRINSINLSADSEEKRLGLTATMKVISDLGVDVTNESTFYIKDVAQNIDTQSTTPSLTSNIIKEYKIYARYKDFTSPEITIKFDDNFESFTKRVLIEDFTGTWCGNCTNVILAIEKLHDLTDKAVVVAIHRGDDPFDFPNALPLENLLNVGGQYPAARLNRKTIWSSPQHTNTNINNALLLTTGVPVRLGLAMDSSISGNMVNLDVKVKFLDDYSNLKLVVYVLEDKLNYFQYNYLSIYSGGTNPIPNFEHNHVVRATFTNILGDAIPSSETTYGKTYTRNFNTQIPANFANAANMEFVAFVVDQDNNAINVRKVAIGENQVFED